MEIIKKIKQCTTISELDNIRAEVKEHMVNDDKEQFEAIQMEFIKRKNELNEDI